MPVQPRSIRNYVTPAGKEPFEEWLQSIVDTKTRAIIRTRLNRVRMGNFGDAKSLVIHPASTTHHRMDAKSLEAAGISEGLIRLSIGLEDPGDLTADLRRGLRASQRVSKNTAKQ